MSEMIHLQLHSAHTIFHSRRAHLRTTSIKTLGGWGVAADPTGGAYSAPPSHLADGEEAVSLSGFELRSFGPRNGGPLTYC